jgi:hypothetical protein
MQGRPVSRQWRAAGGAAAAIFATATGSRSWLMVAMSPGVSLAALHELHEVHPHDWGVTPMGTRGLLGRLSG